MKKAKKQVARIARGPNRDLPLRYRGLAANLDERKILLAWGLEENEVYTQGQGAEDFTQCLWSFRGQPGELVIVSDMRIFGDTKAVVGLVAADLHARKITLRRLMPDGEITNPHVLVKQAEKAISNNRFLIRGRAKRVGAKGGAAKGFHERERRNARCAEDIVRRLVIRDGIRPTAKLLGKPFSRQILAKHYSD